MIHIPSLRKQRTTSPLSSVTFNYQNKTFKSTLNSPPPGLTRLKKTLTYSQNTSNKHFVKISNKQNFVPQDKQRFTFSARTTRINTKARNQKLNLMSSCDLNTSIRAQRSLSVNPFILSLPQVQQLQFKQEPVLDDFLKIKQLGKGKFGTVWLTIHKKTNFLCALKVISKSVVRQEKVQHQLAKQLRIHNRLKHQNIIDFYGYFADQDNFYILSQYASNGHLFGLIKKFHRLQQPQVKGFTQQTAQGIQAIHKQGYIHRDLKPQNILLQFGVVKICDFGWASQCQNNKMRQSQCGTPLYYSPELVRKQGHNHKLDIWSLGLIVYELMVGRVPFKIWSQFDLHLILEVPVSIPYYVDSTDQLKDFIMKCLQKQQHNRSSLSALLSHEWLSSESQVKNTQIQQEVNRLF